MKNENPPAFPTPFNPVGVPGEGMTLRDYFAAKAMQGYIQAYLNTGRQEPDHGYLPIWSFQMADAMLAERSKQ